MCQEYSPKVFIGQDLYPDQAEDTLPDDEEEEEDDRLSMVALETELQKYLDEDWRLSLLGTQCNQNLSFWGASANT